MVGLVDGVVKLIKTEFGYDLLDALMGFENASKVINTLLTNSSAILTGNKSVGELKKYIRCVLYNFYLCKLQGNILNASNNHVFMRY